MIVSDKHKFVFFHNPKTAGTSIRSLLERYDERNGYYWDHEWVGSLSRIVDRAHITLADFREFSDWGLLRDYYCFGFVRNPYDRVFSAFREKQRQWRLSKDLEFNDYILENLNPFVIRYDPELIHFCPQHFFFYVGNKRFADFIGRFENLETDFRRLSISLGIDLDNAPLPKENQFGSNELGSSASGVAPGSLVHYSEEALALVNRLYDRDFILFDYPQYYPEAGICEAPLENPRTTEIYAGGKAILGADNYYRQLIARQQRDTRAQKKKDHIFEKLKRGLKSRISG